MLFVGAEMNVKSREVIKFLHVLFSIPTPTVHLRFLLRHSYVDDKDINSGWEQIHTYSFHISEEWIYYENIHIYESLFLILLSFIIMWKYSLFFYYSILVLWNIIAWIIFPLHRHNHQHSQRLCQTIYYIFECSFTYKGKKQQFFKIL